MRMPADWMVPTDDRILEYVDGAGVVSPAVVARNVGVHRHYAGDRCRSLTEYGLLESDGDGYYRITPAGERYLAGELDASELDPD